jgi:hypothetical protein
MKNLFNTEVLMTTGAIMLAAAIVLFAKDNMPNGFSFAKKAGATTIPPTKTV